MSAALLLRLKELGRRGGPALLAAAAVVIFLVGISSYGLASDLAVTLGYVAALLCGAFPLAIDRERRRSHLVQASPVAPWAWALGSATGAGAAATAATLVLFAAAGLGGAAGGGVPTSVAHPVGGSGTVWLTPELRIEDLPDDARALRTEVRAYFRAEDQPGAPSAVALDVDGKEIDVATNQTVVLPARAPAVALKRVADEVTVGIVAERTRVLGAERPFLGNALLAAVAPAVAAFALAALGVAAGANLSAPVASLLVVTFLLVASLKGFLLETWEHEGKVAAAVAGEEHDHGDHGGHDHAPIRRPRAVEAAMRTLLGAVPDLPALDTSDRVARGEWAGAGRLPDALPFAGVALLLAAALGGVGVFLRRTS